MEQQSSFLTNYWHVAALSEEVTRTPVPRTINNEKIVLFRDSKGEPVALEDRCPHRQAPLSLGEIIGNDIQCGYHGLTFDRTGICIKIPSQKLIPNGTKVRSYPVTEKQGFVYLWTGNRKPKKNEIPFDFPFIETLGFKGKYVVQKGDFDYRLLLDNLMDLTHLSFTHKNTIGAEGVAISGKSKIKKNGDQVEVSRVMEDITPAPTHVEVTGYSGNVDRWQVIKFTPPCFIELHVGNAKTGTGGITAVPKDKLIDRRTLHVATPETKTSTHYFWVSAYPADSMTPNQENLIYNRTLEVLNEDIKMIEGQQQRYNPECRMIDISEDAGQLSMRAVIEKLIKREKKFANDF